MSIDNPSGPPPGDPRSTATWGFSGHVVTLIRSPEQAVATIRFFAFVRKTIVALPRRGMATDDEVPCVTAEDSEQWALGTFTDDEQTDAIMRALKVIAFDPECRADTLLSLDVHTAYLCGRFGLPEPA